MADTGWGLLHHGHSISESSANGPPRLSRYLSSIEYPLHGRRTVLRVLNGSVAQGLVGAWPVYISMRSFDDDVEDGRAQYESPSTRRLLGEPGAERLGRHCQRSIVGLLQLDSNFISSNVNRSFSRSEAIIPRSHQVSYSAAVNAGPSGAAPNHSQPPRPASANLSVPYFLCTTAQSQSSPALLHHFPRERL